jgi:hypothetical protein
MKSFEEENWPTLSPQFRKVHNKLRVARGMSPIPEPKIDLYVPPRAMSAPLPFNPADPEAIAVEAEFRGLGDQAPGWKEIAKQLALELADWKNITKQLALELARKQLAERQLHTETLHRAIAQFVALAKKESGRAGGRAGRPWARKKIVGEAAHIYGVKARTVEIAIAKFPAEFYFTDGGKGHQVRDESRGPAAFRGLPIELRLLALGLPLPR